MTIALTTGSVRLLGEHGDMSLLDPRLSQALAAIIDDYDVQPPERRERLLHLRAFQGEIGFHGWGADKPVVARDDLDELNDADLIDVDLNSSNDYLVKPTGYGREVVRTYRRELALHERAAPVDLSWPVVRPVLHAIVDIWAEAGASSSGVVRGAVIAERLDRPDDDLWLIRVAQVLGETNWIEVEFDEHNTLSARPTARGVMATRGWPGRDGEVVAEQLLTRLDDLIAQEPDDAKRSLLTRLRDTAMEVGTKTLAEVVSKSVGNAV